MSLCGFHAFETGLKGVSFCTPGGFFLRGGVGGFCSRSASSHFCVCEIGWIVFADSLSRSSSLLCSSGNVGGFTLVRGRGCLLEVF